MACVQKFIQERLSLMRQPARSGRTDAFELRVLAHLSTMRGRRTRARGAVAATQTKRGRCFIAGASFRSYGMTLGCGSGVRCMHGSRRGLCRARLKAKTAQAGEVRQSVYIERHAEVARGTDRCPSCSGPCSLLPTLRQQIWGVPAARITFGDWMR